jgi:hypothetical protein
MLKYYWRLDLKADAATHTSATNTPLDLNLKLEN